ncbi:MAG: hypothetical protein HYT93_04755 [Parcubacteria group bacterium]|nr:hypothetical protein [Parcubacteria group bacterium]
MFKRRLIPGKNISQGGDMEKSPVAYNTNGGRKRGGVRPRQIIPLTVLDSLSYTEKFTREKTEQLLQLWNAQVVIADIETKTGFTESNIRMRIGNIRKAAGLRKRYTPSQKENFTRPRDTRLAGVTKCLGCGKQFDSYNVRTNRKCPQCKQEEAGISDEYYVFHTPG